ncbi:MAG TPA: hypothetical protein VHM01_16495 [Alphaproteobacteria bacterium]|nr:hypothetical protein [Alphaproteobacteria bacterium]
MQLFRSSEDLDALRDDLRAVQRDLRDLARDIAVLTQQARRASASASNWLQRATGIDLGSARAREQAFEQLRTQGERSAAAIRSTVQEHPMTTALGALAIGLAVVWVMTRSTGER